MDLEFSYMNGKQNDKQWQKATGTLLSKPDTLILGTIRRKMVVSPKQRSLCVKYHICNRP